MKKIVIKLINTLYFITSACLLLSACKSFNKERNRAVEQKDENVVVYLTSSDKTYTFSKMKIKLMALDSISSETITLDPENRYQTMHGFGAAITGSTCYNLLRMSPEDRSKFLISTFSVSDGMAYSYIRISIGCSDFSLSEYTCCDQEGIENFALTNEETQYLIPVLKEILSINPDVKILGSPWTCPRWMKVNNLIDLQPYNSWTSGQLNPAYYQDYARYFVKWIQAFAAEGITITSITPQNEPLNRGNSVSLYMSWQEQSDFVNTALAPMLKSEKLKTSVYLFDHNYNYDNIEDQNDYPAKIYERGVDDDIVIGSAYHDYGGNLSELIDIHNKYPAKELIFTETSIGTWNNGKDFSLRLTEDMQQVALGTVNNMCRAVIVWNLMLDNERGPNRPDGCRTCFGAVDIASDYKTLSFNSHYYIIGHLSSVVKQGAVRIGLTGHADQSITASAFENPDGTFALVLLNKDLNDKTITVNDGKNSFRHTIPAKSVASYLW
ncbi:MAG: glucosylceramidase [Prevotellaceae bacterium]|nr:glucosylceramidase [Prevotellaceae bacterium]